MKEYRTFLLCDDESPDYFVTRITRAQDEVKPELWRLGSAEHLVIGNTQRWIRDYSVGLLTESPY